MMLLFCREELAVLQEMLVMVGVRHLIRNVLSSSQLERVENMLSKFFWAARVRRGWRSWGGGQRHLRRSGRSMRILPGTRQCSKCHLLWIQDILVVAWFDDGIKVGEEVVV